MPDTLDRAMPSVPRVTGTGLGILDAAAELTDRGLRLLEAAKRQARKGMRAAGPEGDAQRAAVLAMVAQADADLYEARILLDRLLRTTPLEDLHAPRPVIELPPS